MNIENEVSQIIFNVLKKHGVTFEMITPEKSLLEDLHAESLDIIEMMLAFEDKFGLSIEESHISQIATVNDILNRINGRLAVQ